ncbi:MAG: hypothetical protein JST80_06675 [Bdellovibrionales bacterium]|nr:hypothetical protein [Bdellovibrionales bacterium]
MKHLMLSFVAIILVTGCAKDRTVQDYNNDWVAQQKSIIQQHAGTYQGELVQKDKSVAAFSFTVGDGANVVPANDPTGRPQVLMTGTMKISIGGARDRQVHFENAMLYTDQTFVVHINLDNIAGRLDILGRFDGDRVQGQVISDNNYNTAGRFVLARNAPAVDSGKFRVTGADALSTGADFNQLYSGTANVPAGLGLEIPNGNNTATQRSQVPVQMSVKNTSSLSSRNAENFYEFFLGVKSLDISFAVEMTAANVQLAGTLNTEVNPPTLVGIEKNPTLYRRSLSCTALHDGSWNCLFDTGISGQLIHGIVLKPSSIGAN